MTDQNAFYSNIIVALVTFVVGTFGLYLYNRRTRDTKRRLAKIIELEIENAQNQLKEAKKQVLANPDDPLPEHLYAMPTDSWTKNKHLFVENFKPNEWNAINEFYDLSQLYDEAISHNDARFAQQESEVRRNVHKATYKYAIQCSERLLGTTTEDEKQQALSDFYAKRDEAIRMLTSGEFIHIYTPNKQNQTVKTCLENIDTNISLGVVGQKLHKLSKHKFI